MIVLIKNQYSNTTLSQRTELTQLTCLTDLQCINQCMFTFPVVTALSILLPALYKTSEVYYCNSYR